MTRVRHYFDYKSPYAYLAQEATYALAAEPGVAVEWLPYTLEIGKYLGNAELDAVGQDTLGTRNDHQWRRVRYSYMDCRREANRRGLTIRGPRKIFNSAIAHIAFLYVSERGDFRPFHDRVFERFWRRELDLENLTQILALITECGIEAGDFTRFLHDEGRERLNAIQREAETNGAFGVPSYWFDGKLYWGLERLERVREQLGV